MKVEYLQHSYQQSGETFYHLKDVYLWYLKIPTSVEPDNRNTL